MQIYFTFAALIREATDRMSSDWRESRSMAENGVEPLSIRQNMLWNSGGSITYLACQWLITILVVRLSDGYEAAGTLSLAMSVYNIFSPLAIYRMYTYQVSDVKRENSVGEYLAFRAITSSAALLGCLVYAALTCPTSSLLAVVLYAVYKVAGLLIDVLHGLDQVNRRMDYIGKSLIIQGLFTLAAFCSVFVATSSLELALVSMTVVTVLVGVLYDYPRSSRFESMKVGISREKALHLLRYCFPIVIAAVACAAVPSIPRQFLSFSQGEAALGIYASVAAPVAIIQMGAS
ncbi:MAG: polysaccharide biosynthesis protein, partial [Paraeggerthella sp.]|nr:polysaccharide biosynthesis protein [Paraeggerthella sp.]